MTRLLPSMTETFKAGADARADGRSKTDNPYPMGDPQHDEWAEGWKAPFDLDEEDDPLSNRMHKQDDIASLG